MIIHTPHCLLLALTLVTLAALLTPPASGSPAAPDSAATVAAADGELKRTTAAPRESVGSDLRRLMFGSEGTLGIVTSAIVKLFPLPESQAYGSVLFPSYEAGYAFMHELAHTSKPPASVVVPESRPMAVLNSLKVEPIS